jgi:Leucine-rich repeat (LRR) protein
MFRLGFLFFAALSVPALRAASGNEADIVEWIASQGGHSTQDESGHIVGVDLTSTWITDADLIRIAGLAHLRRLDLSHTRVTDVGMEHLKTLPAVAELNLYYAEFFTDDSIASLKTWKRLERLNLRGTKVTSRVFQYLANLTGLKSLDLAYTQIDDEGFEELAALVKLEDLAIGGNRLSGACLPLLKAVPSLRRLDVGGIQRVDSGLWGIALTDDNLQRLADLTQLQQLSLAGANLSDRGTDRPGQPEAIRTELRDLSKLAKLVHLRVLDLSGTPVSDDALRVLASLPELRELRLGLAANIHDGAIPNLLSLKQLRSLYISGSGITAAGVSQLRKSGQIEKLDAGDL